MGRAGKQVHHPGHGIGAVEQAGGAFHHLNAVHAIAIYLNAVLIAPLLALLAQAVEHGQHPVVAQPPDKGLAHVRARGDGVRPGMPRTAASMALALALRRISLTRQGRNGYRRTADFGGPAHARHHYFTQGFLFGISA